MLLDALDRYSISCSSGQARCRWKLLLALWNSFPENTYLRSIECNLIVQYQRNKIIYTLKVSKRGIEREKIGNLQDLIPRARIQFDL